jgi:23S rRNA G2445 N2-methylase RlmL
MAATEQRYSLMATTNPGLEFVVAAELAQKLGATATDITAEPNSGKCFFTATGLGEQLQSPEDVFAVVSRVDAGLPMDKTGLADLQSLASSAPSDAWDAAVRTWQHAQPAAALAPATVPAAGSASVPAQPTFCVRACRRETRHKHEYTRVDVERHVGAAIHERFKWPVSLKNPELNVYVEVSDDTAVIAIGIRSEASFKARRRVEMAAGLGATPMRRSTCYAMIHLAALKPGSVCVDAMCGTGSLPIEGAINFSHSVHLGGDISTEDVQKARHSAALQSAAIDVAPWDSCRLPLRSSSVDAVCTDLPFGRRHGSHLQNQSLYPRALREYARVVRAGGKAVMLTMDFKLMKHAVSNNKRFWQLTDEYRILVGGGVNSARHGIHATLLVLTRTELAIEKYSHRGSKRKDNPAGSQSQQRGGGKKKLNPIQAAESLMKQRDVPAAVEAFHRLLADGVEHAATCHYKLNLCHQRLKDYPAALRSIEAALGLYAQPGYEPGAVTNPLGKGAKDTLVQRIAREKGNAYLSKGIVHWALGSLDEARDALEQCLEFYPGTCDSAVYKLAEVRKRIEQRDTPPSQPAAVPS